MMSKKQALRALVSERLNAAAEDIFTLFERTLAEYEEELCRSREQHPYQQHRIQQHLWEHPGTEEHPWEPHGPETTQPWTHNDADVQVKEEPEEQIGPVYVKPGESSLLQQRQTEHRQSENQQDAQAEEPLFLSEPVGHSSHSVSYNDWEPFSCSEAQTETEPQNSGFQVKEEPEEKTRAVCVKTEESSLLQQRQSGHRQDTQAEEPHLYSQTEGNSSLSANNEDWEPFSYSAAQLTAQVLNSGQFSESQCGPEPRSILNGTSETTEPKKHQCPLCHKVFGSKSNLQRHSVVHTGEKPFSCSVCNKRVNSKSYLIVHMRSHTGEKPYSCPYCERAFSHRSAFNFHIQTHSKEKHFSCPLCGKAFTLEYYLKVHMRTHSGEKPFSCSVCEASFTQKNSLNVHMRLHSRDRPFR